MRKLGIALALGASAFASSALAGTTVLLNTIDSHASSEVLSDEVTNDRFIFPDGHPQFVNPVSGNQGAYVDSFYEVGEKGLITFESSNVSLGTPTTSTSQSSIIIDVYNDTGQPATLTSTITPAGMGFYYADSVLGPYSCGVLSCVQSPEGAFNFAAASEVDIEALTSVLAYASFSFSISPVPFEGSPVPLYALDGYVGIGYSGEDQVYSAYITDGTNTYSMFSTAASTLLSGFRVTHFDATSLTFAWDETSVGDIPIGANEYSQFIYNTTVTTFSRSSCSPEHVSCLLTFAGFGDPIGQDVQDFALFRAPEGFAATQSFNCINSLDEPIQCLNFKATEFSLDQFASVTAGPGVPEPATWAMMILGFSTIGGMLRRRQSAFARM